ncbi:MAG: hypothetical protein JO108_09405 [Acidobacteriaceae bacterium]|nr:hypothetical protein [Acidobacteriaceae bacterium]
MSATTALLASGASSADTATASQPAAPARTEAAVINSTSDLKPARTALDAGLDGSTFNPAAVTSKQVISFPAKIHRTGAPELNKPDSADKARKKDTKALDGVPAVAQTPDPQPPLTLLALLGFGQTKTPPGASSAEDKTTADSTQPAILQTDQQPYTSGQEASSGTPSDALSLEPFKVALPGGAQADQDRSAIDGRLAFALRVSGINGMPEPTLARESLASIEASFAQEEGSANPSRQDLGFGSSSSSTSEATRSAQPSVENKATSRSSAADYSPTPSAVLSNVIGERNSDAPKSSPNVSKVVEMSYADTAAQQQPARTSGSVSPQFSGASVGNGEEKPAARTNATGQSDSPSFAFSHASMEVPELHGEAEKVATQTPLIHTEPDLEPELSSNSSINHVQVQLQGDNNQRVDVRLVDNNGELRVSVRTSDANLAQSLGERIPELTSRLDSQRLHSEVWTPGASPQGRTESSATSFSNSQSGNSSASNYSSNSGGQGNNSRGQNGNPNQPDWLDELEGLPTSVTATRRNSLWLQ